MSEITAAHRDALHSVKNTTSQGYAFGWVHSSFVDILQEAGYIEVDRANQNGDNMAATLTTDGEAFLDGIISAPEPAPEPQPVTAAPVSDSPFEIFSGGALPKKEAKKRKPKTSIYPFDKLENIGDGFFVPATEKMPKPMNALRGQVSSASKRYATVSGEEEYTKKDGSTATRPTYNYERMFKVRAVKKGDKCGAVEAPADGAVVLRVNPES